MRTLPEALAWAEGQRKKASQDWSGLCQKFSRSCWDINPGYASAIIAWNAQSPEHQHKDRTPPPGALVYFAGGQYGHATFSKGNGWIYSTDILRKGKVDLVNISTIEKKWGLKYLGWTDTQGKIKLPVGTNPKPVVPPKPVKPPVKKSTFPLPSNHAFGKNASTTVHNGTRNSEDHKDVISIQMKFKNAPDTGLYGPQTEKAIKSWQIKRLIKPTGLVGKREWDRLGL